MIISLQGAVFFQFRQQGVDQILTCLGTEDYETARGIMTEVRQSHNKKDEDYKGIEYKNFNTLQEIVDNTSTEIIHAQLLSKVVKIVVYDQNFIKLLTYMALFCIDYYDECTIDTKTKSYIKRIQEWLTVIAQRYIFTTYSQTTAVKIFHGVMECLSDLRIICHIKSKRKLAQMSSHTLKHLIGSGSEISTIKN